MADYSDDFNRASGADLGANWTPQQAGVNGGRACRIINNVEVTFDAAADPSAEYWSANTVAAGQYAEITLATPLETDTTDPSSGCWACVRQTPAAVTKYYACARTGQILIVKMDSGGGSTQLGSTFSGTVSVGDVIRLEATNSGSDVALVAKQNGTTRVSTTDVAPGAEFTGADRVGLGGLINIEVSAITAWAGGDLAAAPGPMFRGS